MTPPIHIWLIGDGKSGHENQSAGLAEAIGRLVPVEIRRVSAGAKSHVISRIREANRASGDWPKPDLLIGTGHATHTVLLWLARHHGVPCVVLMKPSLPTSMFDLCLVPVHDLNRSSHAANVIPTVGALNLVPPPGQSRRASRLILIGGRRPATNGTRADPVGSDRRNHGQRRRFPMAYHRFPAHPGRFPSCGGKDMSRCGTPSAPEGRGRLAASLLSDAAEVWVTEDSISMIYEALSSGGPRGPASRATEKIRRTRGARGGPPGRRRICHPLQPMADHRNASPASPNPARSRPLRKGSSATLVP